MAAAAAQGESASALTGNKEAQWQGMAEARESMELSDAEGVEGLGKAIEQAQTRLEEVQEKVKQMTPTWAREN